MKLDELNQDNWVIFAIKNYNNYEGDFVNEYTEKYSLSKNRDIDIIDSIINDNGQKRQEWDDAI